MVDWLAGKRIKGTSTERTTTAGIGTGVGGWVELGRTTLGSANFNMTVSSLANKRYYMVLMSTLPTGSGPTNWLSRIGNSTIDTGSNYSRRKSQDGGADVTATSTNTFFEHFGGEQTQRFGYHYISNYATKEKLGIGHHVSANTVGAGTAPYERNEIVNKWANTSNVMDVFQLRDDGADTYGAGSEVVVLGYDPADTHSTNFWTELASADLSGGIVDTGVFTAKKYLWIQGYCITGTVSGGFQGMFVGNGTVDKTTSYSLRYSINGVSDGIAVNQSANGPFALTGQGGASSNDISFFNIFVINNASNEKLFIGHNIFGNKTAGAGTANNRTECVAKWTNTSNQINRISVEYVGTGSLTAGTLKVWGSN